VHWACGEEDKFSCTFEDYEGLVGDGRLKVCWFWGRWVVWISCGLY